MPFKRYHIAPVWRGERPQAGRYREFAQCDFDTIGTTSIASDIEIVMVINDLMRAIGFEKFSIRMNNRKVLNGLLEKSNLAQHSVAVLRALDKLPKIGRDKVKVEMAEATGAGEDQLDQILQLAEIKGTANEVLEQLAPMCSGNELARKGREELFQIVAATEAVGFPEGTLSIDVSIARGLDYYTGTIVETFLDDLPEIRQRLLRRSLRQSGSAVHQNATARHWSVVGFGSFAGGDGKVGHDPAGENSCRCVDCFL